MAQEATREKWMRLIELHAQGELTVRAFCQSERISIPSFYAWKKRLHSEAAADNTFTPVTLVNEAVSEPQTVEVRFPGGVVMQLPTGDEQVLRQVVQLLIASGEQP